MNKKVIWVNGCFDVLHIGHMQLLEYAKSLGDILIVGIDGDTRVKDMKGPNRPFNTETDRKKMLHHIKHVDDVCVFYCDASLRANLKHYNVDVMVVGDEYKDKIVIGSELVGEVKYFEKVGDYSTTNVLNNKTLNIDF